MKVIGKMKNNMELGKRYGLMVHGMRGNIMKEINMGKENFIGLIILFMKEILLIIILMDLANIFLVIRENM